MSNRTKYDGHLTDSLIQAVIYAEIRQWAREVTQSTDTDSRSSQHALSSCNSRKEAETPMNQEASDDNA